MSIRAKGDNAGWGHSSPLRNAGASRKAGNVGAGCRITSTLILLTANAWHPSRRKRRVSKTKENRDDNLIHCSDKDSGRDDDNDEKDGNDDDENACRDIVGMLI
jgi:hypothetical protein